MRSRIKSLVFRLRHYVWKTCYSARVLCSSAAKVPRGTASWAHSLRNTLSNSGGIPIDPNKYEPVALVAKSKDASRRRTSVEGFEGLALDDALIYTNQQKDFSFYPLACAIVTIARDRLMTADVSVLELGCGSGHMRRYLSAFGCHRYLGIDGNPIPFVHSPYILKERDHFRLLDLQQPIDLQSIFDVVCTFEVLEHIREDRLDAVLETIRRHLGPTSIFLGTASLQDSMDVHVTVKPREWWLDRFRGHGLRPCARHEEYERLLARNHPFNWTAANTNIFALECEPNATRA